MAQHFIVGKRVRIFTLKYGWTQGIVEECQRHEEYTDIKVRLDQGRSKWEKYPSDKIKIFTEDAVQSKDDEIIAKIMKLLRLASSPVPAEAELALQKAYELMAKHDIDKEQFTGNEKKYVDEAVPLGDKIYEEYVLVANVCQRFFKVEFFTDSLQNGRGIRFVGKRHHVEISLYVFSFLAYTFRKIYRRTNRQSPVDRKSFMRGLYGGLLQKLTESQAAIKQEYGIVPVNDPDLKKFLDENWDLKDLSEKKDVRVDVESYYMGVKKGKEIDIVSGIEEKKKDVVKSLPGASN